MRKSILVIFTYLIFIQTATAQCPSVSFNLPDSVCAGETFTVVNTSSASGNFEWDACTGDLQLQGAFQSINFGLNYSQQIKAVKDNGNYFVFIANAGGGNLLRYDFGNSPANVPVLYNYGTFGGVLEPIAIDVIKENGNWYALAVNYSAPTLVRVDLGATIDANIASATSLGAYGLTAATRIKIVQEDTAVRAFVLGIDLIRLDFGNSITNTPFGTAPVVATGIFSGSAFDIAYDCKLNKYIGYFYNLAAAGVYVMDFGSTTAGNPTIPFSFVADGSYVIQMVKDGDTWHMLSAPLAGGGKFENLIVGPDLLSMPTSIYLDTLGGILNPQSMAFIQDSSTYYAFFSSIFPANLRCISWQKNCGPGQVYSADPDSFQVVAGSGGYQKITLKITDASGHIYSYTDSVFVSPIPTSSFATGLSCEGSPVEFYDSTTVPMGSVSNWEWDFGDGSLPNTLQNPVHLFPGAGTYTVTLTTQTNPACPSDTYTQNVTVNPLPIVDFTFTDPQCQYYQAPFTDGSQALGGTTLQTWDWDFGDGSPGDSIQNPDHVFNLTGNYDISLIVSTDAGCIDSLTKNITITPSPVSSFTVGSTCVGESASFTNTSIIQGGGTLTYDWDFGDSNSSTLNSPVHPYSPIAGNYDVMLIATSVNGCKDTIIQNIRIANRPVPQFNWTPQIVCEGNQVSFTSTSTGTGSDTISVYAWDFGDTNSSSVENPFHSYADTGFYNVTLTVTSPTDCDSSLTQQVYVIPSPTAIFTAGGVCLNLSTSFNPLVTTPPGTQVDSIVWDFGDGNGFTGITSPSHTYLAPGKYEVTMTVFNDLLCTAEFSDSVEVYPLPVADFNTSLICSGATTTFNGTLSTVANDVITAWLWDFDGAGTSSDSITQFTFQNPGPYQVTLITATSHGCTDTTTQTVTAIQSPDFTFIFNEPCLGVPSVFTYISNIPGDTLSNLLWEFGDGTSSSALSPSYVYNISDTFMVSLQVTNPATGCTATMTDQLIIKPIPQPGFVVADDCEDQLFQFNDTSVVETGSITAWDWDFGTLGSSTIQDPSIIPATPGIYPVNLSVTTDEGCVADTVKNITVYPRPVPSFTPDPIFGSPPLNITFNNSTTGATSYSWDFGDGTSSNLSSPVHIYSDTGSYTVTMIATSSQGCIDTAYSTVAVLIPYLDIAVNNIYATVADSKLKLAVQLVNFGNLTITSVELQGIIENGSLISETWQGQLVPGQAILYNFNSSYEISDNYISSFYCVEAVDPNNATDENLSNNKKCSVISSEFELFSVYPNPFDDELNINFNLNTEGPFELEIYDEIGKLVLNKEFLKGEEGFNTLSVNTVSLSKGFYVVQLRFRDEMRSFRALKLQQK